MCSPLRASLNALRGFSHIRFVEEISAIYCLKLGIALKPNVYPIAQHKLPIGKYAILLQTMYCSVPILSVNCQLGNTLCIDPITQHELVNFELLVNTRYIYRKWESSVGQIQCHRYMSASQLVLCNWQKVSIIIR